MGYGKGQEEFNRTRKGWRGSGKGDEVHVGLGRAMERVVSLEKGRERATKGWRGSGRVGKGLRGLERPGIIEERQRVL